LRGGAVKDRARAAGPVLLAIAVAVLCLADPTAASAAQRPADSVLAWGNGFNGTLGNGADTNSDSPVSVDLPAGTRITAVSAGSDHSLALTSDGSVLAWGNNDDGALGNGSFGDTSSTPVSVDLPAGTRITAISAGDDYSLALTSDGSVLAWGWNGVGQLGDGTIASSFTPVPVDLPAGTHITAISAGDDFSLALTSQGSVLAWGDGLFGELGDGSTTDSYSPIPVDLPAGTDITAIAAGNIYSLALTSQGTVLAWGDGLFGELGDGSIASSFTPVPVDLPAGTRITAIATGDDFGLALTSQGTVLAWGYNGDGELGNGTTTDSYSPIPMDLPAGSHVTAVAAGGRQSLALTSGGRVLASGWNGDGQLGNGTTTDSYSPIPVDLPAGTRVSAIAAGSSFNLALTAQTSCRQ
jgi:molybdopterin-binding protein